MVDRQRYLLDQRAIDQEEFLPLWFATSALERYRQQEGYRLLRTNTVGRLHADAGWSLDFGFAEDDRQIHLPVRDLAARRANGPTGSTIWSPHPAVVPSC
ncbi:MAG: hypothetical protein KatS3mg061_1437 [Dehalococcoidia bacterium]|nr:MAG: hypothetical protein KatS3mg061_1437 [Dehalococcoidia bacterium]